MDKRKVNLKVGITVIISILILLYGVAFLKQFRLDLNENELSVFFQNTNGLKEGDPVSVNGVAKGKVKTIALQGDSVKVDFTLSKEVTLKNDYIIQVSMIELMSGKQILIYPGKNSQLADISKPLVSVKSSDVVNLISTMNDVGDVVKKISYKLDTTTNELNKTLESINSFVGDEGLRSNLRTTAGNLSTASRNFNSLIDENRVSIRSITNKLNNIADNFDRTITESRPELKGTLADIRELTTRLDTLTENMNTLFVHANDTTSTVGKLANQDELYNNINKTVLNIDKLVKKIHKDGIRLRLF